MALKKIKNVTLKNHIQRKLERYQNNTAIWVDYLSKFLFYSFAFKNVPILLKKLYFLADGVRPDPPPLADPPLKMQFFDVLPQEMEKICIYLSVYPDHRYSVTQSFANSFWGYVVLDSFNNVSRDEGNILYQIYIKQMCSEFYHEDLKFWERLKNMHI